MPPDFPAEFILRGKGVFSFFTEIRCDNQVKDNRNKNIEFAFPPGDGGESLWNCVGCSQI
ncbi:hypothetical protein [Methanosarcina lacustris]|uniref:hypothetical protein n=1 Tax=Methanosarcina lacustris TaxID=170861 RepID=UPI0012F66FCF|nr:hypothetical protein [Methanosarcina lacustris]